MITKILAGIASGFGERRKLLILTYHRVLERHDDFVDEITMDVFETHVKILSEEFSVLRLDDAAELLSKRRLPPGAVCITFDDGYADNFDIALPVLRKYGVPATFFIASGYLDGGIMWNDVVRESCRRSSDSSFLRYLESQGKPGAESTQFARIGLMHEMIKSLKYRGASERDELAGEFRSELAVVPSDGLMMSSAQVAELATCGMEIGAHTVNHPILKNVSSQEARCEIEESRTHLQNIIGGNVSSFAFPNGRPEVDFDESHLAILRDLGFHAAVTTEFACARYEDDHLELPRLGIWDTTRARIVLRLLQHYVRR